MVERVSHLEEMFAKQGDFSLLVRNLKEGQHQRRDLESRERLVEWSRTYILAAHAELSEMLETVPSWKPHRRNPVEQPFDRDAFLEEGVDVFNYLLSALLLAGITHEEFHMVWRGKLDVLEQRLAQEVMDPLVPGDQVVMIDLDGVVADFRSGIFGHAGLNGYTDLPQDRVTSYELEVDLGIQPEAYRKLKEDFHNSGGLRKLPRFGFAREMVEAAAQVGRIVFLSAREGDKNRRIYRDTLYWLKQNFPSLTFSLHFDRNKADWLQRAEVQVVAAIEDEPKTAQRLARQFPEAKILAPAAGYNETLAVGALGHVPNIHRALPHQIVSMLWDMVQEGKRPL